MHKISITVLPQHYRPDADLDKIYSTLRAAGIDGIDFSFEASTFGAKNGYEDWFFKKDMDELKTIFSRFKDALDRNGLVVNQTHTPFPTVKIVGDNLEEYNSYLVEATHKTIELTAFLGGKYAIVHPVHYPNTVLADEQKRLNMAFYPQFIETAKRCGVKICLENMWGRRSSGTAIFDSACADPREACEYIDELNAMAGEEIFAFCFDAGHANLCGKHMQNTIRTLGHRLQTLHLHDTDKVNDLHTLPYTCIAPGGAPITDWQGMLWGLRDIGYRGFINFEASIAFRQFPEPTHPAVYALFAAVGRYFSNEITEE